MSNRLRFIISVTVSSIPLVTSDQAQEASNSSSTATNLFWSVAPILFVLAFILLLLRRAAGKAQKRTDDYIGRQEQHNQRVEQLLERIAKAVEGKDTDVV